jgi:hypothetical protein
MDLFKDTKNRKKIKKLWFNAQDFEVADSSIEKGFPQSIAFSKLLKDHNILHEDSIFLNHSAKEIEPFYFNEIELRLLSPMKSDMDKLNDDFEEYIKELHKEKDSEKSFKSCIDKRNIEELAEELASKLKKRDDIPPKDTVPNLSSIAFILKYYDVEKEKSLSFLFLADAGIDIINTSLENLGYSEKKPLEVEFVKLSHHGSMNSINHKFLKIVKTKKYITLTNCSKFQHPNKETLSFIIINHYKKKKELILSFNYKEIIRNKISKDEEEQYEFTTSYEPLMRYVINE